MRLHTTSHTRAGLSAAAVATATVLVLARGPEEGEATLSHEDVADDRQDIEWWEEFEEGAGLPVDDGPG